MISRLVLNLRFSPSGLPVAADDYAVSGPNAPINFMQRTLGDLGEVESWRTHTSGSSRTTADDIGLKEFNRSGYAGGGV